LKFALLYLSKRIFSFFLLRKTLVVFGPPSCFLLLRRRRIWANILRVIQPIRFQNSSHTVNVYIIIIVIVLYNYNFWENYLICHFLKCFRDSWSCGLCESLDSPAKKQPGRMYDFLRVYKRSSKFYMHVRLH
jgi:hypothetical protein